MTEEDKKTFEKIMRELMGPDYVELSEAEKKKVKKPNQPATLEGIMKLLM